MEKPKEWTVLVDTTDNHVTVGYAEHSKMLKYFDDYYWNNPKARDVVRVIEKSAYDQLLADARELQKALEHYSCSYQQIVLTGPEKAAAAIETFTKKYGRAE